MNIPFMLKKVAERLPRSMGQVLSHVPFSCRLGPTYSATKRDMIRFLGMPTGLQQAEVAQRVAAIFEFAYEKNGFYRRLYKSHGMIPDNVREFSDVSSIPIATKAMLKSVELEERVDSQRGAIRTNTGGTSGEPLSFYLDRNAFGREWAHMHFIWSKVGYRPSDLKLTFRGRNLGGDAIRYNAVHNEYMVNPYCPQSAQVAAVKRVASEIRFVHGYPSSIYEFIRFAAEHSPDVIEKLRSGLKGVLLGSEYPAPVYRDLIESELDVVAMSWYGHSEMAVLAYEVERYLYRPLHSYGFCEAVQDEAGKYRLIGTSYSNVVHPFIRYDTGDIVEPEYEDGMLSTFRISEGRAGDVIEDRAGNRISLTALIFGRHHPIFDAVNFVQVRSEGPGKAVIIITPESSSTVSAKDAMRGFDLSNVDMEFSFEVRSKPVRSRSGKISLLVDQD